jgi:hypothetical protein
MTYQKEKELINPVKEYFESRNYATFEEVKLFARNIDIIARKGNDIASIELKLRDWKRALAQAYLNLRVSNYSYVALPEPIWNRIDKRIYTASIEHGIGLLSVDGVTKLVLRPERSKRIQPQLRKNFFKELRRSCLT